jgi:hypothetical protein
MTLDEIQMKMVEGYESAKELMRASAKLIHVEGVERKWTQAASRFMVLIAVSLALIEVVMRPVIAEKKTRHLRSV